MIHYLLQGNKKDPSGDRYTTPTNQSKEQGISILWLLQFWLVAVVDQVIRGR